MRDILLEKKISGHHTHRSDMIEARAIARAIQSRWDREKTPQSQRDHEIKVLETSGQYEK